MSAGSSSRCSSVSDEARVIKDEPPTDEPWKRSFDEIRSQIYILVMFPFGEAIAWTSTFPYLYAMIKDLSPPDSDEDNIATYAGAIVGAFTLGEAIGAQFWARVSDRMGRKPVLLMGNMGAMLLALVFGCSLSVYEAVAVRFLAGFMNPNIATVNTMIGELVIKKDQAKTFSTVHLLRIIATIMGPALGGYLAEPVAKFPLLFPPGSIWDTFPFLFPNVIAALSLFTSAVLGLFLLEESHSQLKHRPDISTRLISGLRNLYQQRSWHPSSSTYEALRTDDNDDNDSSSELATLPSPSTSKFSPTTPTTSLPPPSPTSAPPPKFDRRLAFTNQVILQVASYALLGYLKVSTIALQPVYLGTPPSHAPVTPLHILLGQAGGFGMSTTMQSHVFLTMAVSAILAQWVLVKPLINAWGPRRTYMLVLTVFFIVYIILPGCTLLPMGWAMLIVLPTLWAYGAVNTMGTTTQTVMMTNSCPDPIYLATVNGFAVTCGSLTRTIGPAVTGSFYRLGLKIGYIGIAYWSMGCVCVVALVVSVFLREHA